MEAQSDASPVQGVIGNGNGRGKRVLNKIARDARGCPRTSCTRRVKHRNHGLATICGGTQKFFNFMFIKEKKFLLAVS
jgi:hypothetical protein